MRLLCLVASFCLVAITGLLAQSHEFYPGAEYDADVPPPSAVLGYEIGEYFTDHHQMVQYIHVLQKAVPERVRVIPIGESVEHRKMFLVVISAAENMRCLEEIRTLVASLRDPRSTTPERAKQIAESTPAIAFMNYANDGNESAAFEACLQVAYHFAAGRDPETLSILKHAVIVLDPAHNPESHQRYVAWMKASVVGPHGTAEPAAAEHHGDWRMSNNNNHYQIDLNRDAFALSQQETQIIAEQLHHWNPQVFVDHHGETNEYFFAPYARPVNTNLPSTVKKWADVIGHNNARAFDHFGWSYFSREIFDIHYPGYWDSYPALNGAVGMTYETDGGGRKGLRFERPDKTILTFRDGIQHHVVASITTIKTAADNHTVLLEDYYNGFRSGMQEVQNERIEQIVLVPGADEARLADLIDLLLRHRIEVFALQHPTTATRAHRYFPPKIERTTLPAGSYVVPLAQPQKRLAKALLEADAAMEEGFIREARENYRYNHSVGKKAPKERLGFYDVTAWSLPLVYGVDAYGLEQALNTQLQPLEKRPAVRSGVQLTDGAATYAYAFDYRQNNAAKLLAQLQKEDFRVAISRKKITIKGKVFPRGLVVVRVERNPESLHGRIAELSTACEVPVFALASAWTDDGILLGSNEVVNLKKPRIAVITEEPTRQTSYGAIWFLLEKRYGIDFTALRLDYFSRVDLRKFDVLVFPPGTAKGYARSLGEAGIKRVKQWIEQGGVFVGVGGGAEFAAGEKVAWTTARLLGSPSPKSEQKKDEYLGETDGQEKEKPDFTPGAILKVNLDTNHFLALGYGEQIPVLVRSKRIFTASKEGANVGLFAKEGVRVSGFVWEKTEKMFPGNAYLIHEPLGRGKVILFAEEPIFRLYWRGLEKLFLNSLLLAPSF